MKGDGIDGCVSAFVCITVSPLKQARKEIFFSR